MQVWVFKSQKLALAQAGSTVQAPPMATMGAQTRMPPHVQYKPSSAKQTVGTEFMSTSDNHSSPL
jgi:hypothetical protein